MSIENGPGEGTWSVFAEKMMKERDDAIERISELEYDLRKMTIARDHMRSSRNLNKQRCDEVQEFLEDVINNNNGHTTTHEMKNLAESLLAVLNRRHWNQED